MTRRLCGVLSAFICAVTVLAVAPVPPVSAAEATLSGSVTDDIYGSAVLGAVVDVLPSGGGTPVATATTDLDTGAYSLLVEEGTYDIRVTPPAESEVIERTFAGVSVAAPNTTLDLQVLNRRNTVTGVVAIDGVTPLDGVDVRFTPSGRGALTTVTTDVNGTYSAAVPSGSYVITVLGNNNALPWNNFGSVVAVSSDATIDVAVPHAELVQGTARLSNGIAAAGVEITFTSLNGAPYSRSVTTDTSGNYAIEVVAASFYTARITGTGPGLPFNHPDLVRVSGPTTQDFTIPVPQPITLQGIVTDPTGTPVDGAAISIRLPGTQTTVAQTTSDPTGFYIVAVDAGTYDVLAVGPTGSGLSRYVANVAVAGTATLDIQVESSVEFVEVSGTVFGPGDLPANGNNISFYCPNTNPVSTNIDQNGTYTLTAVSNPTCNASTNSQLVTGTQVSSWNANYSGVDTSTGTADLAFPTTTPITITVVNPDNTPANVASISSSHNRQSNGFALPNGQFVNITGFTTTTANQPTATHPAFNGVSYINVTLTNGTTLTTTIDTNDTTAITLLVSNPPVWLTGSPTTSNDGDNVSDLVEALAPNNGDGNGDGTPDYQQVNVTSLPSSSGNYVTVAAPADTTLANVRTIDPTPLAPPPQLTLPEGLTDFRLDGVAVGQDVTLSIYTTSTANVTGYAKYQNGAWSVLPSDRVAIFSDRVEITLTDGGIGDDDGVANGVVVDPGGIVIQTAPLDTTPPTVTSTASPAANAAGWHNTPVTIDWTATDPEPSSGPASDPADTTVTANGADQIITSGASCDASNNCATGTTTVSIDTVDPILDVVAPLEIRVDQALTITCTASDALSGIATDCTGITEPAGTLTAGTTVQYTFTATDRAGNTGTRQVAVTVLPPLNTAPTVRADMGVAGLETIGFQSATVVLFGSFTDAENNGPFTAAIRWTATGNFVNTVVTGNGQFLAAWAYTGASARTVTVRICDAAGACGTDTITIRPSVTTKVTPLAPCVTDRGAGATGGRYEARWGYRNPAAFAIYVPTINDRENTFTSTPYRRGQPEVFLPGTNRDVFRASFNTGTHTWRLNGTNVTARSTTSRC